MKTGKSTKGQGGQKAIGREIAGTPVSGKSRGGSSSSIQIGNQPAAPSNHAPVLINLEAPLRVKKRAGDLDPEKRGG